MLACEGELCGLNLDERNSTTSELAEWSSSLESELQKGLALGSSKLVLVLLVTVAGASVKALAGVAQLVLAMLRDEACALRSRAPLASLSVAPLTGAVAPLTGAVAPLTGALVPLTGAVVLTAPEVVSEA